MTVSGTGTFFDGKTSARHAVVVELDREALLVRGTDGALLARWPYEQLDHVASQEGVLRLGLLGSPRLERLEVRELKLAAAIDEISSLVDRTGATQRRLRRKVALWTFGAVVSLVLVGVFGVPALATRLAPFVPWSVEHQLAQAVEPQVRAMLDEKRQGAGFLCGQAETEHAGRAAMDALVRRLETAAALPVPLRLDVVRKKDANAFALPGGRIYVFDGLIEKSETPDELAGVIAHEIGHVAHRDGTRSILQAAGLSFVFGMVLGDFVGGGAVVIATTTILQSSYARDVETAADLYAVDLMRKAGGNARAFAAILQRIAGAIEPGVKILLDHPATAERVALINQLASFEPRAPLLNAEEWSALKRICSAR